MGTGSTTPSDHGRGDSGAPAGGGNGGGGGPLDPANAAISRAVRTMRDVFQVGYFFWEKGDWTDRGFIHAPIPPSLAQTFVNSVSHIL